MDTTPQTPNKRPRLVADHRKCPTICEPVPKIHGGIPVWSTASIEKRSPTKIAAPLAQDRTSEISSYRNKAMTTGERKIVAGDDSDNVQLSLRCLQRPAKGKNTQMILILIGDADQFVGKVSLCTTTMIMLMTRFDGSFLSCKYDPRNPLLRTPRTSPLTTSSSPLRPLAVASSIKEDDERLMHYRRAMPNLSLQWLSNLVFYQRIFYTRRFRNISNAIGVVVIIWLVGNELLIFLSCFPQILQDRVVAGRAKRP